MAKNYSDLPQPGKAVRSCPSHLIPGSREMAPETLGSLPSPSQHSPQSRGITKKEKKKTPPISHAAAAAAADKPKPFTFLSPAEGSSYSAK